MVAVMLRWPIPGAPMLGVGTTGVDGLANEGRGASEGGEMPALLGNGPVFHRQLWYNSSGRESR